MQTNPHPNPFEGTKRPHINETIPALWERYNTVTNAVRLADLGLQQSFPELKPMPNNHVNPAPEFSASPSLQKEEPFLALSPTMTQENDYDAVRDIMKRVNDLHNEMGNETTEGYSNAA